MPMTTNRLINCFFTEFTPIFRKHGGEDEVKIAECRANLDQKPRPLIQVSGQVEQAEKERSQVTGGEKDGGKPTQGGRSSVHISH